MVDLFLIFFILAIIGISVAVNVKLLLYFQQEEDSSFATSIFCKAVIVVSLTLAWLVNLLLPIDVRNSRPRAGPLDMQTLWLAAFITLAVFLVVIVPAVMFYNEVAGDITIKNKKRHALCNFVAVLLFSICSVAISFPFLSSASIPIVEYSCESWQEAGEEFGQEALCSTSAEASLEIQVGFDIYVVAVLCFIGWLFFVIFGGIGLSAVPIDLIMEFIDRPKAVDEATYVKKKEFLGQAAQELLAQAEGLKARDGEVTTATGWGASRSKRKLKAEYNKWRRDVLLLEEEVHRLQLSKFHKGENPVVSYGKLVLGIFFAIVSFLWVLQIILNVVVTQIDPHAAVGFLEGLFSACEGAGLYPVGVSLFATFTLYLLLCVVKGCFKFGMRIFLFFSIHPMRHKATPLHSILFNVEMVLISSAAVVQFVQTAFANYARLTDADVIFAAQIKYLTFYSWFFENNVFVYLLLAWSAMALVYLVRKPRDKDDGGVESKKALKRLGKIIGKKSPNLLDPENRG